MQKVGESTTYTKREVDKVVGTKANKSDVGEALEAQTNASNKNTKDQVDDEFGPKANQSTTYTTKKLSLIQL